MAGRPKGKRKKQELLPMRPGGVHFPLMYHPSALSHHTSCNTHCPHHHISHCCPIAWPGCPSINPYGYTSHWTPSVMGVLPLVQPQLYPVLMVHHPVTGGMMGHNQQWLQMLMDPYQQTALFNPHIDRRDNGPYRGDDDTGRRYSGHWKYADTGRRYSAGHWRNDDIGRRYSGHWKDGDTGRRHDGHWKYGDTGRRYSAGHWRNDDIGRRYSGHWRDGDDTGRQYSGQWKDNGDTGSVKRLLDDQLFDENDDDLLEDVINEVIFISLLKKLRKSTIFNEENRKIQPADVTQMYVSDEVDHPVSDQNRPQNRLQPDQNRSQPDQNRSQLADQNRSQLADQNRTPPDQNRSQLDQNRSQPDQNRSQPQPDQNRSQLDQNRSQPDQNRSQPDQNRSQTDQNRTLPDQNRSQPDQNRTLPDQNRSHNIPYIILNDPPHLLTNKDDTVLDGLILDKLLLKYLTIK